MSFTLFLIRHAKSDWSDSSLLDFDRPLNNRGHRVAPKMAAKLKQEVGTLDKILSSDANRAAATTGYFIEQLDYLDSKVDYEHEIYEASARTLLGLTNGLNDEWKSVAFIGHNPGMTYFAEYLTGEQIGNIPTCGIVKISMDIDSWRGVSENLGRLDFHIYPRMFDF